MLLFGPLQDAAGCARLEVLPPPVSLKDLRRALERLHPDLGPALSGSGIAVAVDRVLVRGDPRLAPECEVAFLPPMSGG